MQNEGKGTYFIVRNKKGKRFLADASGLIVGALKDKVKKSAPLLVIPNITQSQKMDEYLELLSDQDSELALTIKAAMRRQGFPTEEIKGPRDLPTEEQFAIAIEFVKQVKHLRTGLARRILQTAAELVLETSEIQEKYCDQREFGGSESH